MLAPAAGGGPPGGVAAQRGPRRAAAPEPLRLSAKRLGDARPDACPRCLWVSLRFDLPYQRFPGVFGTIDRFIKNAVHGALDGTGRLPPWFPDIGRVASYERDLSYKRFRVWHEDLGVDLVGLDLRFVLAVLVIGEFQENQSKHGRGIFR